MSLTLESPAPAAPAPGIPAGPKVRRPRRWRLDHHQIWTITSANAALIVAMWARHGGLEGLSRPGGWFVAGGQLGGLLGTYLVLIQLLLMSRTPWLEQVLGRDRLVAWHRWVGFGSVSLLAAHAALITLGYAASGRTAIAAQVWSLLTTYPDVLMAAVGLTLFLGVAVTSVRAARRRLAYETWYFIHLYAYLAVALSFAHQLAVGTDFVNDPVARIYWVALYAAVAGCLLGFRLGQPLLLAARHQLRVAAVVPEAPGVVSIYVAGRNLHRLAAESGQFFQLRFLTRQTWWRSHPFSLSAAPDGRMLRFTVKALGDYTSALQRVPPGVRLLAEGPYGAMTGWKRTQHKVLLIAGGVGITPLRALLETVSTGPGSATLIYRASSWDDVLFRAELEALSRQRGATVHYLVGRRGTRDMPSDPLVPEYLGWLVPDVLSRDIYVCGPPAMTEATGDSLRRLGVPHDRIHSERFAY